MPGPGATKKANKSKPAPYDAGFPEDDDLFDPNTIRAADKKRGRNAGSKKKEQSNGAEDIYGDEVTRELSTSPNGPSSMLGQIPYSFPRNHAPADVLDALSESVKVSDQYSARTDAWAQDVPYGKSPPGNSVVGETVGESPPVQGGYLARGGFNTKTPPRSPAQRKARPVSFSSTIAPVPTRQQSEYGYRQSGSNYGSPPALPHLPQHHFYAAHDINFGLGPTLAKEDTQRTFMAFRELPAIAGRPVGAGRSGVFVGSKDRLDILASSADGKYEHIGALVDLAGDVTDAMPLIWESGEDPFSRQRPLVAIAVHGKSIIPHDRDASDNESIATGLPNGYNEINQSAYETRVEVYSLKEQAYITTLLRIPSLAFSSLAQGSLNPDPAGDLRLNAFGNHLVISSGTSGEVFVCGIPQSGNELKIECLAKFWTNVQPQSKRRDSSHSRSPRAAMNDMSLDLQIHQAAILSGRGRWLAICPPGSSHSHLPTLSALTTRTKRSKVSATVESRNPPALPSTTCAVESPDVDTMLRTIARGAAKQAVKGATWLGNQGVQAWNSYWNKDEQQHAPPNYLYSPRPHPQSGLFPPTHASESISQEPDVVSIIDLKTLSTAATFQPPKGCSFLSFTPDGLGLLTASKKGDVQYVWDLKQMKNVMSIVMINDGTEMETAIPRVRQIAKFERMTPTTIVDVIWEPALGERFALVTKKGTVHLFDLPLTASRWPSPRQTGTIRPATAPSNTALSEEADTSSTGGILSSALNIASMAPPMLASLRGRAPSLGQGIAGVGATGIGIASATGIRGGRAVAAGLSRSLGAATGTMQNLRHAGETRLHVDSLATNPAPGVIAFGRRNQKPIILILDRGSVKSYNLSKVQMRDKNNKLQMTSVFGKKALSFKLPHVSSLTAHSMARQNDQPAQDEGAQHLTGFWPGESRHASTAPARLSPPLSQAENESYAPQQPFHFDPRVNLSVYSEVPAHLAGAPWVFGTVLDGEGDGV
jgi:WD40 repeat protein